MDAAIQALSEMLDIYLSDMQTYVSSKARILVLIKDYFDCIYLSRLETTKLRQENQQRQEDQVNALLHSLQFAL